MRNAERLAVRQAVRRQSVLVAARVTDSTVRRGSGFVVWRSGATVVLLTNAHVVTTGRTMAQSITVRPYGAARAVAAYPVATRQSRAQGLDYAFLVVTDSAGAFGDPVDLAPEPAEGDAVLAVGNPLDEDFLVDAGTVTHVAATPTGHAIYHSALIDHGSSGGGLFTADGRLVGINTYVTEATGEAQEGIALAAAPLLKAVRFHVVPVTAQADGWQESGLLVRPGTTLNLIATGVWKVSPWLPALGGAGAADPAYARYSVDPTLAHGALLYRVGPAGPAQAVDRWWRDAAPGATMAEVRGADALGTLRFRINDQDVRNNSGQLTVTVLEWRAR